LLLNFKDPQRVALSFFKWGQMPRLDFFFLQKQMMKPLQASLKKHPAKWWKSVVENLQAEGSDGSFGQSKPVWCGIRAEASCGMSTYVVPEVLGWHNSKLREKAAVCVHYHWWWAGVFCFFLFWGLVLFVVVYAWVIGWWICVTWCWCFGQIFFNHWQKWMQCNWFLRRTTRIFSRIWTSY